MSVFPDSGSEARTFQVIFWSTFLPVNRREKAEKIMRWFSNAIRAEVTLVKCEPYETHPERPFEVRATTPLGIVAPADALFETLRICTRVAGGANITGPRQYEGNRCEFLGELESGHLTGHGIPRLSFSLRNFD